MADKRKTGRIIKRLRAKIFCEGEERRGISSNFSLAGIFIKSRKIYKPGTPLNIILDLSDNQILSLRGEIAWVKLSESDRVKKASAFDKFNEGMGIKLNESPQEYKEFLKVLIKEQL